MKEETKFEIGGGILLAVFAGVFLLLVIIFFAPVGYYLGKWGNYWSEHNEHIEVSHAEQEASDQIDAQNAAHNKANYDCKARAAKRYGTLDGVGYFASSTSETADGIRYATYTCWGLKYDELTAR